MNIDPGHDSEDGDDVNSGDTGVVVDGQSSSSVPSGQSLKHLSSLLVLSCNLTLRGYLAPSHLL